MGGTGGSQVAGNCTQGNHGLAMVKLHREGGMVLDSDGNNVEGGQYDDHGLTLSMLRYQLIVMV